MKDFSIKKLVLSGIALLSSIALLLCMSSYVVTIGTGINADIDNALNSLGLSVTSFQLLSFKFPAVLAEYVEYIMQKEFVDILPTVGGIFAILQLASAIAGIITTVITFFVGSKETANKTAKAFIIVNLIVSVVALIIGIIMTVVLQIVWVQFAEKNYGVDYDTSQISFGTGNFISLIFSVVFLIAYIVCAKFVPETIISVAKKENKGSSITKSEGGIDIVILAEKEATILFRTYKELYDGEIISSAEYIQKKGKLLNYTLEKASKEITKATKGCSLYDAITAEKACIEVIKEYKKLAEEGIISDGDYLQKKAMLLTCIIE